MVEIRQLNQALGAEVTGVDLNRDDPALFDALHRAFLEHCVLVIRDQTDLTPEAQIAFSRRFGELEIHVAAQFLLPGHPEILQISNRRHADRSPVGFEDAGRYWHSDLSYKAEPSLCSLLYAVEIPPRGGDTLFANMYRAYGRLSEDMKARIADLKAAHSYGASFEGKTKAPAKRAELTADQKASLKVAVHPVVRRHPETGRKALFVNEGFTTHIVDMEKERSNALLHELFAAATVPDNVYSHAWRPHDLVVWDNRCTLHHATPYDSQYSRHMHRTTVRGDRPV